MAPPLHDWETFYVIVGSSAAALTGLQFVVIALVAEARTGGGEKELQAFGSPTIVHFCAVLLVAAIVSTPHQSFTSLSACLAIAGVAGFVYVVRVSILASRTTGYKPVLEDWMFHSIFPLASYGTMFIAGMFVGGGASGALYFIAIAALLLLYVGIHNAWDTAIYISVLGRRGRDEEPPAPKDAP